MCNKYLEILTKKAKDEINTAMSYAMQIENHENKTNCLNAQYYMGRFAVYVDIIEDLDMAKFTEIWEDTRDMRQFITERIDRLYR